MAGIESIWDLAIVAMVAGITGLICRGIGLSVVVGYLLAGMLIGPYTPPFQLVQDEGRIQMLANLGLVFLIFGIGLGFSIRRMKRLGASLLLATALGAVLVLVFCRMVSSVMGFSDQQGLFIAAVLMVSSSAIIAKVLEEVRSNHARWGQLALGVTLLEDIVAVIMLTLLTSLAFIGDSPRNESIIETMFSFGGFVMLFSMVVLLLVPRLLRWLERVATVELRMILVAGLLLMLGFLAQRLGYSMALTAFILGMIIGSTPHRPEIDRLFEGLRHLFGAVFFVAMGMMFNVSLLPQFWPALLALTGAAFLLRIPALTASLVLVGNDPRDAIRSAIALTPLGEFSFVIALLGVSSGIMPQEFYPAAVGASLLTCLISPALIRRADVISDFVDDRIPKAARRNIDGYHAWLERVGSARQKSIMWRLLAPRIMQTAAQLLVIAGCLALARPTFRLVQRLVGPDLVFPNGTPVLFSIGAGILLLAPLVAVWRNISALSMIVAEASTQGTGGSPRARVLIERAFASAAAVFALLALSALIPTGTLPMSAVLSVLLIFVLVAILLWRSLILWQSRLEIQLQTELAAVSNMESTTEFRQWSLPLMNEEQEWNLRVEEFTVPSDSLHAGKTIIELRLRQDWQCSIVGIDRQGYAINNPPGQERIFPEDRLLLLGSEAALKQAVNYLSNRTQKPDWMEHFDELGTETVLVPPICGYSGKSLAELDLVRKFGIQIGGIRRGGMEIASPGAAERLYAGDNLLVLGTHDSVQQFAEYLRHAEIEQKANPEMC